MRNTAAPIYAPISVPAEVVAPPEVRDFVVQVTVTVQTDPPMLHLAWSATAGADSYRIYRRAPGVGPWGRAVAVLPGDAAGYTDRRVAAGVPYEYRVVRMQPAVKPLPRRAYGYATAGIAVPLLEHRGVVLVLVDSLVVTELREELSRLEHDLVGDGWTVIRRDVNRSEEPTAVKALIREIHSVTPLTSVFLLGHLPVAKSGWLRPDGHDARPFPCDAYYADCSGDWTDIRDLGVGNRAGDGIFDQQIIPGDVEIALGRVDMAELPAFLPLSEIDLLRRYLNKNHCYRHGVLSAAARAIIDDNFGVFRGEAFAQNGWRNFAPLLGPSQIRAGKWNATGTERYLWGYGCGPGGHVSCGGVAATAELAQQAPSILFTFLFGSYFCEWDVPDALQRAVLAWPDGGLICGWAGRPNWFIHGMALGQTIGDGVRLAQRNSHWHYQPTNGSPRGVHIALMGDPTLRLHIVPPPADLAAQRRPDGLFLTWLPALPPVLGYLVYRAVAWNGPYTRLTPELVTDPTYCDAHPSRDAASYMVRAVTLTTSPSGSYYNASQGIFVTIEGD